MRKKIYVEIRDYIYKQILLKKIINGEQLPSVRELAKHLQVNPNTVQKAYLEIEEEGICQIKQGNGRYLTIDDKKIKYLKNKLTNDLVKITKQKLKDTGLDEELFITNFQLNDENE